MESWCDQTVCNCAHSKIMKETLSDEQNLKLHDETFMQEQLSIKNLATIDTIY